MSSEAARKDDQLLEHGQFTLAVKCHWCGHSGVSLWEEANGERQLVRLDGFYERLARKVPYPIETVCNGCGKVQPI